MTTKNNNQLLHNELDRRKFISGAAKVAGAAVLMSSPLMSFAGGMATITVR